MGGSSDVFSDGKKENKRSLRRPRAQVAQATRVRVEEGRKWREGEEGKKRRGAEEVGRRGGDGAGRRGDAPLSRTRLAFLSFRTAWVSASLLGAGGEGARPSLVRAAAAMWPPDPDPDTDPEPVGRSPPGAPAPGLRALLPARAFLCSLKGRLLLAESVSAARPPPAGPLGWPGAAARMGPAEPSRSPAKVSKLAHISGRLAKDQRSKSEARRGPNPGLPGSLTRQGKAGAVGECGEGTCDAAPGPLKAQPGAV